MLSEMKTKGQSMVDTEKATFATYKEWVDDRTTELGFEVKTAEKQIEQLVAFADKADSDVSQLASAIKSLEADIGKLDKEKKESTEVREAAKADFSKLEQDYSESVDALTRAIQHVSTQAYNRPQVEALLQRMGAKRALAALIQKGPFNAGAPAVDAYEHQTGGVLEILQGLLEKFKGELDDLVSDETNQAHYYNLQQLHITNTVTDYTGERDEKVVSKSKRAQASAKAKGELAETRASLAEDQKFLADMTATFRAKSATFAANQDVRANELEAISKAIEIISSPEAAASYAKHVNFAQIGKTMPALVQLGSSKRRLSVQQRAAALLSRQATRLGSARLSALASRAGASPFVKVADMIETLLARLKEEALAEADHKQWCDEQLKDNKLKREKKTSTVNLLSAEMEQRQGQIEAMASSLATLAKEQQDLNKAMSEAEAQRSAEAKENADTIADAKAGQSAIKQALVVLKEFYASQGGEGAALLQGRHVPEMKEYKGMQSEKGGVIGMLEVIESDFARLEADTTAAETQAAREHASFMDDAKADSKQKHDAEVKTKLEKDQAEFEQSRTDEELKAVQEELAKANEYYETLKPSCLEVHVSYEERVARREEEIAALKQAHQILDSKSTE
jgi:predicted  nucleic acid-binding Zn-ribbon protein